jgi:hypothetical protein
LTNCDWSSDVCSSDLERPDAPGSHAAARGCALATILLTCRQEEWMVTTSESARRVWCSRRQAILWTLSTAAAILFGGALTFATVDDMWRLARVIPPTPPEVTRDLIVRNASDLHGRRASFRILLFTDEFRWRLSSHNALENGLAAPDFTPEMKAVLDSAHEIICVGTSSEEISGAVPAKQSRTAEERRAARRADQIALWVRRAVSKPIPVRKLNIGQHVRTGHARDTSDQRRVVIVLVLEHDDQTDLDQALRSAMVRESARAPVFEALLKDYSLSSSTGFTWEN